MQHCYQVNIAVGRYHVHCAGIFFKGWPEILIFDEIYTYVSRSLLSCCVFLSLSVKLFSGWLCHLIWANDWHIRVLVFSAILGVRQRHLWAAYQGGHSSRGEHPDTRKLCPTDGSMRGHPSIKDKVWSTSWGIAVVRHSPSLIEGKLQGILLIQNGSIKVASQGYLIWEVSTFIKIRLVCNGRSPKRGNVWTELPFNRCTKWYNRKYLKWTQVQQIHTICVTQWSWTFCFSGCSWNEYTHEKREPMPCRMSLRQVMICLSYWKCPKRGIVV